MTGAADAKKPGTGMSTTGGPLPEDDASSAGVEEARERIARREDDERSTAENGRNPTITTV